MIKVLIVEDSPVVQRLLNHILSSDPELTVIGTASNGEEALEFIDRNKPDVITMDLLMPRLDGYATTRKIMETTPIPVVVVSANLEPEEERKTWLAIEAGAVAALEKPRFPDSTASKLEAMKLVQTVKLMSQVKLVRRWAHGGPVRQRAPQVSAAAQRDVEVVAVGASTGGPNVLRTIFSGLPGDFPAPILVVQHISPGFCEGFVRWLNEACALGVEMAAKGVETRPGHVYVAPDGFHLGIHANRRISLTNEAPEHGLRPSVASLFRSVTGSFGKRSVGILLTGMGRDGAVELKEMKEAGAVTIAQDKASSIVHGMPGEAMKLGAAQHILPPEAISRTLAKLVGSRKA